MEHQDLSHLSAHQHGLGRQFGFLLRELCLLVGSRLCRRCQHPRQVRGRPAATAAASSTATASTSINCTSASGNYNNPTRFQCGSGWYPHLWERSCLTDSPNMVVSIRISARFSSLTFVWTHRCWRLSKLFEMETPAQVSVPTTAVLIHSTSTLPNASPAIGPAAQLAPPVQAPGWTAQLREGTKILAYHGAMLYE